MDKLIPKSPLQAVANMVRDSLPRGVPHRIIPALWATGFYQGVRDPRRLTGMTHALLRRMAATPLVRAIINKRKTQATMFAHPVENRRMPGFQVRLRNSDRRPRKAEMRMLEAITQLVHYGGYDWRRSSDGRVARWDGQGEEKALRFDQTLAILVEDLLVLDAAVIRLESPVDPASHPAYWPDKRFARYASDHPPVWYGPLDGARIRTTSLVYRHPRQKEDVQLLPVRAAGYKPEIRPELGDAVAYVEVDHYNHVVREFADYEISYAARNLRADDWTSEYGRSPLEYCAEVLTGVINGISFNTAFFNDSHIPPGILSLAGEWDPEYIENLRTSIISGLSDRGHWHKMLVLLGDVGSEIRWTQLRQNDRIDMHWEKWITFLTNLLCSLFEMAPEEINFQAFRQQGQAMQEADPLTRILYGYDTGFVPMMLFLQDFINEALIWPICPDVEFTWTSLHRQDEARSLQLAAQKLNLGAYSINEVRADLGDPPWRDPLDTELWGEIEQLVMQRWPATRHNTAELRRITEVIYENRGGKYAQWPDAPGAAGIVQQLYFQEKEQAKKPAGGGFGGGFGGMGGGMPPMPGMPPMGMGGGPGGALAASLNEEEDSGRLPRLRQIAPGPAKNLFDPSETERIELARSLEALDKSLDKSLQDKPDPVTEPDAYLSHTVRYLRELANRIEASTKEKHE